MFKADSLGSPCQTNLITQLNLISLWRKYVHFNKQHKNINISVSLCYEFVPPPYHKRLRRSQTSRQAQCFQTHPRQRAWSVLNEHKFKTIIEFTIILSLKFIASMIMINMMIMITSPSSTSTWWSWSSLWSTWSKWWSWSTWTRTWTPIAAWTQRSHMRSCWFCVRFRN